MHLITMMVTVTTGFLEKPVELVLPKAFFVIASEARFELNTPVLRVPVGITISGVNFYVVQAIECLQPLREVTVVFPYLE